jgi:hypothetical protein
LRLPYRREYNYAETAGLKVEVTQWAAFRNNVSEVIGLISVWGTRARGLRDPKELEEVVLRSGLK